MSPLAQQRAQDYAKAITGALGGRGVFGVELFIKGDEVIFSEVSPRPHDTGMVTMISQDLSQFALHARAILGLPIPGIRLHQPSASSVLLVEGESQAPIYHGLDLALAGPDTQVRLFGKPNVQGRRRMGVALASGATWEEARQKANAASAALTVEMEPTRAVPMPDSHTSHAPQRSLGATVSE
jgi:phosphoribosylglycinamide formyltransferase 2